MSTASQHHGWKRDSGRYRRPNASSMRAPPTMTNNDYPGNYNYRHDKTYAGI